MHVNLDQLKLTVDPLAPLYVLIDPLGGEPVAGIGPPHSGTDPRPQREQAWGREITPVVLAKTVALPRHQHPYLVMLHDPDDPWLELTLRIAEGERVAAQSGGLNGGGGAAHRIAGWLQSAMDSQELADTVSAMCRVNTSARTNAKYLRLADRRVLDLLCHVVGTARLAGQFGRLHSWVYLDSMAQIRRIASIGDHAQPLYLDTPEWQRIERGEMLHRTIAKYLGERIWAHEPVPQPLYSAAEQAVIEAASAARRWPHRFTTLDDETTWAALLLIYPSLYRLPAVQKMLEAPGTEDEPPEPLRYLHRDIVEFARSAEADIAI